MKFQSTRPIRGATPMGASTTSPIGFQSTRPIRGATILHTALPYNRQHFNPRAPYGARLNSLVHSTDDIAQFQSTRPIRGATTIGSFSSRSKMISIHAPHTGRDKSTPFALAAKYAFQSTRPIRGATCWHETTPVSILYFNPRAPYGARQHHQLPWYHYHGISIHAPHTGRDLLYMPAAT